MNARCNAGTEARVHTSRGDIKCRGQRRNSVTPLQDQRRFDDFFADFFFADFFVAFGRELAPLRPLRAPADRSIITNTFFALPWGTQVNCTLALS